jgi:hypothetical protein
MSTTVSCARISAACLLPLLLSACPPRTAPLSHRVVVVFDPTVLREADPSQFEEKVGTELRRLVTGMPEASSLDVFFVGEGQIHQPPDYRVDLPFEPTQGTNAAHMARVGKAADSVVALARARWAASNESPNRPASCILTALHRTQETIEDATEAGQAVTLVVVSDFLEACGEIAGLNFERSIPDSVGALAAQADLSEVDALWLLRMEAPGTVSPQEKQRLDPWWNELLVRWKAPEDAVRFRKSIPSTGILPRTAGAR